MGILIVEDDPALAGLLERYCQRLGQTARLATTATAARAAFLAAPAELAIIDLTLPDEPGDQLAASLMAQDAGLRVILTSGYPASVDLLPEPCRPRAVFLPKPFRADELAAQIRANSFSPQ